MLNRAQNTSSDAGNFKKKEYQLFSVSLLLLASGFICMSVDPVENGFGVLTLWVAPPLLIAGFILPVFAILNVHKSDFKPVITKTPKSLSGFFVFLCSLSVYLFTLEPTASLWDCAEFIAAAYKLQVPHTPGTPLSLLIARMFAMLALDDVTIVARNINIMSAVFSAFTVWLVFDIIYLLGEKIVPKGNDLGLVFSSIGGSLCLAFSDTFWFSAVEAETYAAACFFLVLLVRLLLTYNGMPADRRGRLFILIFYLAGLGYCIHPMCLLALPVLPLASLSRERPTSFKIFALFLSAGLLLVLGISRLVAVGLFELAFYTDLVFVNSIHLPFYSGAIFLVIVLISAFVYLLKKFTAYAHAVWAVVFLLVGFSPYLILFIRSNHNPPIDETNPENLPMIKAYMNRETYPSSPLVYGPYFDANIDAVKIKKKIYHEENGLYKFSGTMADYHYESSRTTILPRLYSNDPDHIKAYRRWTGLKESESPKFVDNLKFMFGYQLGHMYLRYFLWNFAGRESDHQQSAWLGPWDEKETVSTNQSQNNAHNQLYMIPMLLGILGMWLQFRKDRNSFYFNLGFFLVTGLVLALYLNSTPNEPRERDYIYVGSYIAFFIWVGLGLLSLSVLLNRSRRLSFAVLLPSIAIPYLIFYQNYDDHDRSGRTFQVDNARNILGGCAPNAILFTGGDNDTFPLWYLQEVEGYRTDVRVMVLSYFNTDWYINQLRKPYYKSPAFLLSLEPENYRQYGPNDVLYIEERLKGGIDVAKYLALLKSDFEGLQMQTNTGDYYNILPSRTLQIKLDKQDMATENTIQHVSSPIPSGFTVSVNGNYLQKNGLAVLDLIVTNRWQRPIYFNFTSLNTVGIDFNSHVIQEGNLYRLVPYENTGKEIMVDTSTTYKILVEDSDYSNLANNKVYFNYEDYQARIITPVRQSFNSLAVGFLAEGNADMAKKTLQFAVEKLYPRHLEPSYTNLQAADILFSLGDTHSAKELSSSLFEFHFETILSDISNGHQPERLALYLVTQSAEILNQLGETQYLVKVNNLQVPTATRPF